MIYLQIIAIISLIYSTYLILSKYKSIKDSMYLLDMCSIIAVTLAFCREGRSLFVSSTILCILIGIYMTVRFIFDNCLSHIEKKILCCITIIMLILCYWKCYGVYY